MPEIGVQSKNIVDEKNPAEGFEMMRRTGFTCCDFSLNARLTNNSLYRAEVNSFFDRSLQELEAYFQPHKDAAAAAGIRVHQMHMPYPVHVPGGPDELNAYLRTVVAPRSIQVCTFFDCHYIVVHGFKLAYYLGSEEAEWEQTENFLEYLAPVAKECGVTLCIENLYTALGSRLVEGPCCDVAKAVRRIDRMNEKYGAEILGFCFDTGHANLVGLDFEDFITTLGKRLKVLHMHDNDGMGDLHQIPFTFTRSRENLPSTDWEGFVKGMRNIQFDGVLSFETAPTLTAFPDSMKEDTLAFIAKIGKYFADEIEKK